MAAVDKETTELKLRFFNNCFHDDFSNGKHAIGHLRLVCEQSWCFNMH